MLLEYRRRGPDHVVISDGGVGFVFSRVVEHRDQIDGILRVLLVGFPGHPDADIFNDRIVLTGIRSRPAVAKDCQRRCPELSPGEWADLIDEACLQVRKALEDGAPFVSLAEGDIAPDAPWLVENLFRQEEHAVVFGNGGTGKSTLLLWIATCLTIGRSECGFVVPSPARVGIMDFEDSEDSIKRHLLKLSNGLGVPRPEVFYKRGEASLPAAAEALGRQCSALGIDGLIIDSAAIACGTEPESADAANAYFRAIRALPIRWSLTIAHQPKDKERSDDPFGSVFWKNNPRMIWRVVSASEEGADHLDIGLIHRKSNNGRFEPKIGLHLTYTADAITVTRNDKSILTQLAQETGSARDRIRQALEGANGDAMTGPDLSRRTGVPVATIYTVLSRMGNEVEKTSDGFRLIFPGLSSPPSGTYNDEIPF